MNESTTMATFLAEGEEKMIAKFMNIAGLGKEYQEAATPKHSVRPINYTWAMLLQEFSSRGYTIDEHHKKLSPIDDVEYRMTWRISLLHDGNEVVHNNIEIRIGDVYGEHYDYPHVGEGVQ